MESRSLSTASSYINNLLLSRGLLRDGTPIDFATPEKAKGRTDATMVKIMNLVHDLILRRDHDVDTLGNLSQTLQTLRSSSAQQTQSIARLEARNTDLDRQLVMSSTQDDNAKKTVKQAEAKAKALKEELLKVKGSVSQIRQQCANDLRRRDLELARLKKHLEGRRGREGNGGQIGVTVITPGISKPPPGSKSAGNHVDLASSQYNLRQETTEFLTQLSQGLSNENDALIGLVKDTLSSLRHLQGLPPDPLLNLHDPNNPWGCETANIFMTAPPSYEALASSTEEVMANLHGLLTNPSFVPLEEVQIRDAEIQKLRAAWEKMEARWRETLALMDSWRTRMEHTGDTINLADLRMGMDLGTDLPEAPSPSEKIERPQIEDEIAIEDPIVLEDLPDQSEEGPANTGNDDRMVGVGNSVEGLEESPERNALRSRSGNARPSIIPQKVSCPDIPEEYTKAIRNFEDELILDLCNENGRISPVKSSSPVAEEAKSPTSPLRTIQRKLETARSEAEFARQIEEKKGNRRSGVVKKLRGSRRRSTLSPEELEKLMGIV
ncbi:MAG: hypothetical protein LQ338_004358 [Usnochroma carphineum]|nr:MAG: hypothetical protein LQ338_004358 [Usnochroma carphineum]